jgi:hypothetical protein
MIREAQLWSRLRGSALGHRPQLAVVPRLHRPVRCRFRGRLAIGQQAQPGRAHRVYTLDQQAKPSWARGTAGSGREGRNCPLQLRVTSAVLLVQQCALARAKPQKSAHFAHSAPCCLVGKHLRSARRRIPRTGSRTRSAHGPPDGDSREGYGQRVIGIKQQLLGMRKLTAIPIIPSCGIAA